MLEMTKRRTCKSKRGAVLVEHPHLPISCANSSYVGDGNISSRGLASENIQFSRRDSCQDLVIIASGEDAINARGIACKHGARGIRKRHALRLDHRVHARDTTKLREIANKPVRNIHRGGRMLAK